MAKTKIYYRWEIPSSVVRLVEAICADYDRREQAIKHSSLTGETLETYARLNAAIDAGLESVEPGIRRFMLDDIWLGRGYDFSPCSPFLAKNSYYKRKKKVIHDIAKELKLIP